MPSSHSHSSHSSSHSSHSHSSHSSSHSSHSHSSHSSGGGVGRSRTNQPSTYRGTGTMTAFRCAKHDYEYYPSDWIGDNGILYRAGYYDEKGTYYRNLAVKNLSTMLTCKYCGNQMVYTWKEGDVPSCSKCGANYEIDIVDKPMNEVVDVAKKLMCIYGVLIALAMGMVFIFQIFATAVNGIFGGIIGRDDNEQAREQAKTPPQSVYVEEIGRTCYLNGEDYYDPETGMWFYWNEYIEPAQWQYWYDDISCEYEDEGYGWLEYDDSTGEWWIEMSEGSWGCLNPDFYDTSNMWHFKSAYVNELY